MPGRRGRAWGNALGGYRKQPRIGGRFASKGTPGAKISNKARNRRIRGRIYKGVAIGAAAGAVVGAGVYAHKSGLDKKLVKAPSVRITARYAKAGAGVVGQNVMNTRVTQIGPNRYTIQRSMDTSKQLYRALQKEHKFIQRAKAVGKVRAETAKRRAASASLLKELSKASGGEMDYSGDPLGSGQRFSGSVSRRTPTKDQLNAQWNSYMNSPKGLKFWKESENRRAGIKTRQR